jgi:hypothetical protein
MNRPRHRTTRSVLLALAALTAGERPASTLRASLGRLRLPPGSVQKQARIIQAGAAAGGRTVDRKRGDYHAAARFKVEPRYSWGTGWTLINALDWHQSQQKLAQRSGPRRHWVNCGGSLYCGAKFAPPKSPPVSFRTQWIWREPLLPRRRWRPTHT